MKRIIFISFLLISLSCLLMADHVLSQLNNDEIPPEKAPAQTKEETLPEETFPLSPSISSATSAPVISAASQPGWGQWISQGPGPALNGQLENIPGNDPVTGAVHAIVAHPTNADILYIGGVNGGIWKTMNATDASPAWTPLIDQIPSLSIGALEMDPTDGTHQTLVAGFGRYSNFGSVGGSRRGLLMTTDGGSNWSEIGISDLIASNISGVGPRGSIILVTVNTGLGPGVYRSIDTGGSFQFISGMNGLNTGPAFDLVGDPSNQNRFYAGIGGANGGVFRTDDAGASWTDVTDAAIGALVSGTTDNIELAVHNNTGAGTNAVYVAICDGSLTGILRSDDMGGTWTAMDMPQTNEGGVSYGIHPGGQCDSNLSIAADPSNAFVVYVGGDRQPKTGPDGIEGTADDAWPNSISANSFSGRLFRGDASIVPTGAVPSPQWTPSTHMGTASNSSPHADSREIVFDANGSIIEGDDGGVYRQTSPATSAGDWESVNGNLQITEFHDIAYDTISNIIIGGAQDTGTPQQMTPGGTTWDSVSTADGGDVAVDIITLAGSGQSIRYSSNQRLGSFRRRTYDSSNTLISQVFPALATVGGGTPLNTGTGGNVSFKTPIKLNAIDPTRLIIGGLFSTYESLDQGATVTEIAPGTGVNGGTINQGPIAYGGRHGGVDNPDVLYVGEGDQVFVRTAAGGALNAATALPAGAGTIRDLVIDPDDWMTAYVIDSNQVFFTDDAGTTWTDITGDLGLQDLKSIEFIPGVSDFIFAGSWRGVFAMRTDKAGVWSEVGTGLPNALVYDLDYDINDDVLVAGTLGRGAWLMSPLNRPPVCDADGPYVKECAGSSTDVTLDGSGSFDPEGNPVTYFWTGAFIAGSASGEMPVVQFSSPGVFGLDLEVTDDKGSTDMCIADVTIQDTIPPDITAPADVSAECTSPAGASPDIGTAAASDICDSSPVVTNDAPAVFPLGATTVTWTAKDGSNNMNSDTQTVNIVDTTPPSLNVEVSPDVLWPPNHKIVQITPTITVSDTCDTDPVVSLTLITMNEGDETNTFDPGYDSILGDGHTSNDIDVDENGNIFLRAERSGLGNGRIYTITYTATDASGNSTTASASVTVPHNQ